MNVTLTDILLLVLINIMLVNTLINYQWFLLC